MTWALSTRWAPQKAEAPDLDVVRLAGPPAVALARGLPARLSGDVRQLAAEFELAWLEAPWPDADVDQLDTSDRDLRRDTVRAALQTVEAANSLECALAVSHISSAGDALRYALDPLLPAAERHGVIIGLRGSVEPDALRTLLAELAGAPVGWVVDLQQAIELAEIAGDRVAAYVLPSEEDADVTGWKGVVIDGHARVLDPDPGVPAEALHERAAALNAALAPE